MATGKVTVDGTITANGLSRSGYYDAGGSGGGISITCNTFEGSGVIRANGGDTWIEPGNLRGGGSGGGGRIAIRYDPAAQAAVNPKPTVLIQANGGTGIGSMSAARRGASGTIYLSDTNFFPTTTFRGGEIVIPGFTNWSVSSLTVTDGWMALPAGFQLTVSNDLTLNAGGGLCLTNAVCGIGKSLLIDGDLNTACFVYNGASSSFTVGSNVYLSLGHLEFRWMLANDARTINVPGSLTITNWGYMYMYSGTDTISRAVLTCAGDFSLQGTFQITSAPTNDPSTNYGALVSVRDMTLVATNSWVYPVSHELNGGSPLFRARNLTISTNAGFNADYRGFSGGNPSLGGDNPPGYGPGRSLGSTYGSGGAGYGGAGGAGSGSAGGGVCGSSNAPVDPGSGSGGSLSYLLGRYGGGLVRIEATETVAVNGTITANGNSYPTPYTPWAGGGSGGGIYITCKKFSGDTNGLLRANGGDGGVDALGGRGGGGGGGGRIAVWRQRDEWHGTAQCSGGLGDPGEYPDGDPGAIVWGQLPVPGTVFVVH